MGLPEVNQATGALSSLYYNREASGQWGTVRTASAAWKALRLLVGEGLDQNPALYNSEEIRADRYENPDVLGTEDVGGPIPCEMSPSWGWFLPHLLGATVTTTAGPVACVQAVSLTGSPTGGTFRLGFRDKFTTNIAFGALNSAVQAALEALSTIGAGNVTVSGTAPNFVVTFAGTLAATNAPPLEGDGALLTGGTTPGVSVAITTRGVAAGMFKHKIAGGQTALPTGFTLEKGFSGLDAGSKGFFAFAGCRVDSLALAMNINAMLRGNWDIVGREMPDPTTATISSAPAAAGTEDPFTSSQIAVMEGATLVALGIARQANLTIGNNLNRDSYILGSRLRANLKPGRFAVGGDMTVMFKSTALYEKAKSRADTRLLFASTSGENSLDLHVLAARFNPTGSVPKVNSDQGIEFPIAFKGQKPAAAVTVDGVSYQTPLVAVLVSSDADLTV
jgi:hypothetical protein